MATNDQNKFKLNDDIDNESLLYILLENINSLVTILSLSFLLISIVYFTSTSIYQSNTLLEIQEENNFFQPTGAANSYFGQAFSKNLKAEIEIYKSDDTIGDALKNLEAYYSYEEKEKPSIGSVKSGLTLKENRNTLIEVNLRYPDQELSQIILNELNKEYIKDRKDFKKQKTALGRDYIKKEIPRIRGLLSEAEGKLNNYKLSSNSVGVIFGSDDRNLKISDLKERLSEISFKEFELKEFYKETHPIYVTLIQQKELLENQLIEIEQEIPNIPKTQRDLENFQREVKLYSEVLKDLSVQELSLAMNEASSLSNVRIINSASSGSKVSPRKIIFVFPFIILFFSYLIFALNNFLRDKISHQDALIDFVGKENVIGELPFVHKKANKRKKFLDELCNELLNKTTFEMTNNYEKNSLIMITSSRRNVGKTEISKRIFEKFLESEKKICLLDLDYRKADLTKRLFPDKEKNIKNFDEFYKRKDEFILGNSLFIPAFDVDNPVNFFNSDEFKVEIEKLKNEFDFVICDTPPWTLFVDAKILSNKFDNFIYIVGKKISSYRDIDLFIKDQTENDKISYFFNKYELYFDFLWLKLQHPYYYSNYYYDYYSGYGDRLTKYSDLLNSWKFLKGIFLKWFKSLKK